MWSALLGMGLGCGIDVFPPAMGRGYSSAEGTHITSAPSADKHLKDSGNMLSCPTARPTLPTGMSNVGNHRLPGVPSSEGTHITSAPSADKHLKDSGNMLSCPPARPTLPTGMSNVGNPRLPGVA